MSRSADVLRDQPDASPADGRALFAHVADVLARQPLGLDPAVVDRFVDELQGEDARAGSAVVDRTIGRATKQIVLGVATAGIAGGMLGGLGSILGGSYETLLSLLGVLLPSLVTGVAFAVLRSTSTELLKLRLVRLPRSTALGAARRAVSAWGAGALVGLGASAAAGLLSPSEAILGGATGVLIVACATYGTVRHAGSVGAGLIAIAERERDQDAQAELARLFSM